jgi:N-acetylglucosaminyl-diphospho-decaprenol L-rhamnosyltransferase
VAVTIDTALATNRPDPSSVPAVHAAPAAAVRAECRDNPVLSAGLAPGRDPAMGGEADTAPARRVGVAIAPRERREALEGVLERLLALPERPPVVVADNGSADGTPAAIRARFPQVEVLELRENRGAAARNAAVAALGTPYVAFSDDDSWWAAGALARAAEVLDAHPRLGLLAARILVGPDEELDPVCALMARSPLPAAPDAAGPAVLGFVACGAVVRREAFEHVGGFDERYGIGGEETPLALDLAAAGWQLAYVDSVVAHHHPADDGARPGRRAAMLRNEMWSAWSRRPAGAAMRRTAGLIARNGARRHTAAGVAQAVRGAAWVARERRVLPADVEHALRVLERAETF